MDPQLKAQCAQTIYVAAPSSTSNYGDQTYGSPTAVSARVEFEDREVTNASGEMLRTDTLLITEDAITLDSRIWLPGVDESDATLARRAAKVIKLVDEKGALDHYETYLANFG